MSCVVSRLAGQTSLSEMLGAIDGADRKTGRDLPHSRRSKNENVPFQLTDLRGIAGSTLAGTTVFGVVDAGQRRRHQLVGRRATSCDLKGWTESLLRVRAPRRLWRIGHLGRTTRQCGFTLGRAF